MRRQGDLDFGLTTLEEEDDIEEDTDQASFERLLGLFRPSVTCYQRKITNQTHHLYCCKCS